MSKDSPRISLFLSKLNIEKLVFNIRLNKNLVTNRERLFSKISRISALQYSFSSLYR